MVHTTLDMKSDPIRLETLALLATEVTVPVGLTLDDVEVQVEKAEAAMSPFSLQLVTPATLKVRIGTQNIAAFLEKESPGGLKDFVVQLEDGLVSVEATARILVELRVTAVCRLRTVDRSKIFVDLDSVSVKAPMVHGMVQQQLDKINPILDMADIGNHIQIESVGVADGFVTVMGSVSSIQSL